MRSGRPLRANSAKPPIPSRRKRPRQNVTACWLVPKVLATWMLSAPVAHSRIRRARKTIRFSFPSRVHRFCLDSNPFQILFKVAYLEAPVSVVNLGVRDPPTACKVA